MNSEWMFTNVFVWVNQLWNVNLSVFLSKTLQNLLDDNQISKNDKTRLTSTLKYVYKRQILRDILNVIVGDPDYLFGPNDAIKEEIERYHEDEGITIMDKKNPANNTIRDANKPKTWYFQ